MPQGGDDRQPRRANRRHHAARDHENQRYARANANVVRSPGKRERKPPPLKCVVLYNSFAPPRPSTAPVMAITPASSITTPKSVASPKPIVFSTATSRVRSRALIIIAFAVTSRIANTTAMPIVPMSKLTFPHIVAKLALNACSVPVFDG